MDAAAHDARFLALQAEMTEFEEHSSELEAALEEEKTMLEMDLNQAEKTVESLTTKVERMTNERAQLLTQRVRLFVFFLSCIFVIVCTSRCCCFNSVVLSFPLHPTFQTNATTSTNPR